LAPGPHDNHPVSQASQLSPELARDLLLLARALLGAVRNWTLCPLGKDHEVVLETIEALRLVPSDVGVSALARVIARRGFFGRRRLRTLKERGLKERGVGALGRIGTPAARTALADTV
jgi:hypothetical protein